MFLSTLLHAFFFSAAIAFSPNVQERRKCSNLHSSNNAQEGIDRRSAAVSLLSLLVAGAALDNSKSTNDNSPAMLKDENWQGTSLNLLPLEDAYDLSIINGGNSETFPFAQWPDPILRRPSSRISLPTKQQDASHLLDRLQSIARTLQRTVRQKRAVGLAAQQCGVDVSLVYLDSPAKNPDEGIFLLNPRIVARSPERNMQVWTEECLVLPPSFRATLLRDESVVVEYESIFNISKENPIFSTNEITLSGELARAAQHEMNHDAGILIVDHVDLEELPPFIREIEKDGHSQRMAQAFRRDIAESSLVATTRPLWQEAIVPRATAEEIPAPTEVEDCDAKCLAERKRRIEERRAMMKQSRSNTKRQDVFELSQQRAAMYNTEYKGVKCPQNAPNGSGIPCI